MKLIRIVVVLSLVACSGTKPFQPPPHPAMLWEKNALTFTDALSEMKKCGWIEPKNNLDSSGKINMNIYAEVDKCMLRKGFSYVGRTPLLCEQLTYQNLSSCK
ncbi:hypothetical protein ACIQW9_13595 [Herminiimonas sp. NPDC097707]|uniref:hypothetical protein n=1 Tax=Herminiimonas sp. NPDC097707 TaxID=3364007 RepID=UPI00383A2E6B